MARIVAIFLGIWLLAFIGCSTSSTKPGQSDRPLTPTDALVGELTVFAGSSLTEAFNAVKAALQAQHPNLSINYNFAGTPTLRTQIEQGARADVFASANEPQMELAVKAGVIQGTPVLFAANHLVAVSPANSARVQELSDLASPGVKLVLALKDVPVGGYARDSIERMAASGDFGPDFSARVLANLVSEEPNVRQALSKVVLGEADAAIVYTTDLTPDVAASLRQISIPDRFNVVALYPIAVVQGTARATLAEQFISYLSSPDGRAILAKHGFKEVPQ